MENNRITMLVCSFRNISKYILSFFVTHQNVKIDDFILWNSIIKSQELYLKDPIYVLVSQK